MNAIARDRADRMYRNVRLACSFGPNGGDMWYMEAADMADELEQQGNTVLDDWTVLYFNEPCPIRDDGHWELAAK